MLTKKEKCSIHSVKPGGLYKLPLVPCAAFHGFDKRGLLDCYNLFKDSNIKIALQQNDIALFLKPMCISEVYNSFNSNDREKITLEWNFNSFCKIHPSEKKYALITKELETNGCICGGLFFANNKKFWVSRFDFDYFNEVGEKKNVGDCYNCSRSHCRHQCF